MAVNELPFAAAGDQPSFAQNLQVMRNGRRCDAAHRDNLAAVHMLTGGDGFENSKAGLVSKGFGYFFNPGAVHGSC